METGFKLDIHAYTSFYQPLVHNPSTKNEVYINFYHRFRRFTINDSDGTLVCTGFDPAVTHFPAHQINLSLFSHDISPIHLCNLIDYRLHDRTLSSHIASSIAAEAVQYVESLHPYVMSVDVLLIKDLLSQKEEEEEESTCPVLEQEETEEETCAICLEGLYNNDDEALDLPWCSHRFHHRCIGQWLLRQNSCPLCREIVL